MSKKKNKFKRSKKHHQTNQPYAAPAAIVQTQENSAVIREEPKENKEIAEEALDQYPTDKYDYVKHDIKKILIIMTSIIILLFGFYYLGFKTTILNTAGNWVYKVLNIQTL